MKLTSKFLNEPLPAGQVSTSGHLPPTNPTHGPATPAPDTSLPTSLQSLASTLNRFPPDAPPIAPAGSMELANVQPVSATPVEDPQVNQGGLPAGPPAEQPCGTWISEILNFCFNTLHDFGFGPDFLRFGLTPNESDCAFYHKSPHDYHSKFLGPCFIKIILFLPINFEFQVKVGEDILHQHASMFPGPQFGQCCGTSEPNSLCGVWIVTISSLVHQAFMSSASSVPLHSIIHFILEYATCHGCFLDKMVHMAVQQEDQLADHPGSLVGLPLEWLTQAEHWPVPCCQLGQWVGHQEGICSKCWPGIEGWWAGMCLVLV
ncbi:hypothetical protein F5141DRAFT_1065665 [Pisolithus sp. B1]|nr:hypothetical protein F5141DRAFT_1065665 [Pisolithus sp. B1]